MRVHCVVFTSRARHNTRERTPDGLWTPVTSRESTAARPPTIVPLWPTSQVVGLERVQRSSATTAVTALRRRRRRSRRSRRPGRQREEKKTASGPRMAVDAFTRTLPLRYQLQTTYRLYVIPTSRLRTRQRGRWCGGRPGLARVLPRHWVTAAAATASSAAAARTCARPRLFLVRGTRARPTVVASSLAAVAAARGDYRAFLCL